MKTVLSATFLDKGKPAVMLGRKTKGTDEPRGDRSAELPRIDKIGSEEDSTQKAKTRRDCGFFFFPKVATYKSMADYFLRPTSPPGTQVYRLTGTQGPGKNLAYMNHRDTRTDLLNKIFKPS